MRCLIMLALLAVPAAAQSPKGDKLDVDAPRVVRTIPIARSDFESRWYGPPPVGLWLGNQPPPSDRFTPDAARRQATTQNAPAAGSVDLAPLPRVRPRPSAEVADICTRHGKTKVFTGKYQWRCK